jgi:hypothetical protein
MTDFCDVMKKHKLVAEQLDKTRKTTNDAMMIVAKFIQNRNLILVGGMAIDYALAKFGEPIYDKGQIPDYDFNSVDSVNDAFDLVDILRAAGFKNVDAIKGMHSTTTRVRVDFIGVADISYQPPNLYEKIKTFMHGRFRCRHPHDQMIDQHMAFCYPINNIPMDDVTYRWEKDLKRYNLLWKHYPIIELPMTMKLEPRVIDLESFGGDHNFNTCDIALSGMAAYAVLYQTLKPLAVEADITMPGIELNYELQSPVKFQVDCANVPLDVISPLEFIGDEYDPISGMFPKSVIIENVRIASTYYRLVSIHTVETSEGNIKIVSPQFLLMHFLIFANYAETEEQRNINLNFYVYTRQILDTAEQCYVKLKKSNISESIFAPSLELLGKENFNTAYVLRLAAIASRSKTDIPFLNNKYAKLHITNVPPQYYADKERPSSVYDYDNILYKTSGKLVVEPAPIVKESILDMATVNTS